MRIGFFCPHSDPLARAGEPDSGGQCIYESRVATAMAMRGPFEVHAFTRRYGSKPEHESIAPGAHVFRLPMGPEGFLRKEEMGPHLPEFTARLMHEHGPWLCEADVFHGHYWDGGVAALNASLALGKPLVFTSHSLGILKRDRLPDTEHYRYDIRIPAETRVMRAADRVIALSSIERQAIAGRYGIDAEKIDIVPGGVEVERFAPEDGKPPYKRMLDIEADLMVFTVGRLDSRKGFLEWIRAMPRVVEAVEKTGRSICFMMPEGPAEPNDEEAELRARLKGAAEALGVEKHIRWFGRLEDDALRNAYRAADLFVCPSLYEPFGLVLVEAMAAATPVVATCHGGPVDIVGEGEDGYLADPTDTEAWAEKVIRVLTADEETRRRMGAAAKNKAHDRYAWPAVARSILEIYKELTETGRGG